MCLQGCTHPEGDEYPLVVLCVLAYPRVTVVDVRLRDVLIDHLRHHYEPLRQEVSLSRSNRGHHYKVSLTGVKQRLPLRNKSPYSQNHHVETITRQPLQMADRVCNCWFFFISNKFNVLIFNKEYAI